MTGPQRALIRVLNAAFNDEHSGRVHIHAALRAARRATLPDDPSQLLAFVRAHMMDALTGELGPRVVAALLEELTTEVEREATGPSLRAFREPATGPRPSTPRSNALISDTAPRVPSSAPRLRPKVVLFDGDRFARASLARTLLAAALDVFSCDNIEEVRSLVDRIDVAIVRLPNKSAHEIMSALITRFPSLRVIALVSGDAVAAEATLRGAGVRSFETVPSTIRVGELAELVRRVSA